MRCSRTCQSSADTWTAISDAGDDRRMSLTAVASPLDKNRKVDAERSGPFHATATNVTFNHNMKSALPPPPRAHIALLFNIAFAAYDRTSPPDSTARPSPEDIYDFQISTKPGIWRRFTCTSWRLQTPVISSVDTVTLGVVEPRNSRRAPGRSVRPGAPVMSSVLIRALITSTGYECRLRVRMRAGSVRISEGGDGMGTGP